jgi:hypothetical protein
MPPLEISQPIPEPPPPTTLAAAVELTRLSRTPVNDQLREHRDALIELRKRGESVEGLVRALRKLGVRVGNETLRMWFVHEAGLGRRRVRHNGKTGRRKASESTAIDGHTDAQVSRNRSPDSSAVDTDSGIEAPILVTSGPVPPLPATDASMVPSLPLLPEGGAPPANTAASQCSEPNRDFN